jgi:hypothetical protein
MHKATDADGAPEIPSLSGWVAGSDRRLQASTFAGFAGEVLAGLPAEERAQAFSVLAAASFFLNGAANPG